MSELAECSWISANALEKHLRAIVLKQISTIYTYTTISIIIIIIIIIIYYIFFLNL